MKSVRVIQTWFLVICWAIGTVGVQAHTVLLDFGSANTTRSAGPANDPNNYWNNVTNTVGHSDTGFLANLVSTTNVNTGFGLQMVRRFSATNTAGTTLFTGLPTNATRDSMFGNLGTYEGLSNVMPEFYLYGLDPSKVYNFQIYASRMDANDNREGLYTFTGKSVVTTLYNAADNISNMAYVYGVTPDDDGEIRLRITPGPNNTNSTKYMYMGVLQIQEVPEPTMMALGFLGLSGLFLRRTRWEGA